MQRLIDDAKAKLIGTLVVYRLDRLTRRTRDLSDLLEMFKANGVALVSCTESLDTSNATGRLMVNTISELSQWERELISERTAAALRFKQRHGQHLGNGTVWVLFEPQGRPECLEGEPQRDGRGAADIRLARAEDDASQNCCASGVPTRRGGRWSAQVVKDILGRRGMYTRHIR